MAVVTREQLAQQNAAQGGQAPALPPKLPINKDRYSFRIKKCDHGNSKSSGKPMLTIVAELYHPQEMKCVVNGQTYTVAGMEGTMYMSLQDQALGRLLGGEGEPGFMEACGLAPAIDPAQPDTKQFEGKCFSAVAMADKQEQRKELTPEEIQAGKKVGDPIFQEDGITPSIRYGLKILGDFTPTRYVPKNPH